MLLYVEVGLVVGIVSKNMIEKNEQSFNCDTCQQMSTVLLCEIRI